jgi:hypothetical protein
MMRSWLIQSFGGERKVGRGEAALEEEGGRESKAGTYSRRKGRGGPPSKFRGTLVAGGLFPLPLQPVLFTPLPQRDLAWMWEPVAKRAFPSFSNSFLPCPPSSLLTPSLPPSNADATSQLLSAPIIFLDLQSKPSSQSFSLISFIYRLGPKAPETLNRLYHLAPSACPLPRTKYDFCCSLVHLHDPLLVRLELSVTSSFIDSRLRFAIC